MAGFDNEVIYGKNGDFTSVDNQNVLESNGLVTDGKMWIGSTATNAGGTHINVGTITSPNATLTVGYSSPNITLDLAGGGLAFDSITVDAVTAPGVNPVLPTAAGFVTIEAAAVAAHSVPIETHSRALNTFKVEVQEAAAVAASDATKSGIAHFDSANFTVDANGFVSAIPSTFTWNDVSGAFSPLKTNGYFITGTATGTLPASPAQGDTIKFFVDHASQVLTIDAPGTQIIRLGSLVSSAGGTAVSTVQGDSVELTYRTSDTCWCAIAGFTGTWVMS